MIDDNTRQMIEEARAKHLFLTFFILPENGIRCGVVQNETSKLIRFFDFEKIISEDAKARFLEYADEWWWESNQAMPVDRYIGERFDEFQPTLRGFPRKALLADPIGPTFSLAAKYLKRIKKRRVDIISRTVTKVIVI